MMITAQECRELVYNWNAKTAGRYLADISEKLASVASNGHQDYVYDLGNVSDAIYTQIVESLHEAGFTVDFDEEELGSKVAKISWNTNK